MLGCDINLCIEYKRPSTTSWICLGNTVFDLPRNYQMFALMAGVRANKGLSQYPAKGVPETLSYFIALQVFEDADANFKVLKAFYHHYSWLTVEEFRCCINAYKNEKSILDYEAVLATVEFLSIKGCESRIVFWFHL